MKKDELVERYRARLESEITGRNERPVSQSTITASYSQFKNELLPKQLSLYEKLCNKSEKILKVSPDAKKAAEIQENLDLCHISSTPSGTYSFPVITAFLSFIVISIIGILVFKSIFFVAYALLVAGVLLEGLMKLPEFFANNWRLKASNQMVQSVFYVATFMRHTSNLELALKFAADHLGPPLSLDLKKVLWDVETEKFPTIQESLEHYLENWRKWNPEFIEAFHLIEGSLMESSEDRRLQMVDKALNVMLEETYEKMLRYAHELKGPITMLYMLGIILPILGLVILPLVASFMTSGSDPYTLAIFIGLLYNVTMPLGIFYLGKMILSRRPTGYGETDISDNNPTLKKFKNFSMTIAKKEYLINPLYLSLVIFGILLFIGLIPVFAKIIVPSEILATEAPLDDLMKLKIFDYRPPKSDATADLIGPYGMGSAILSIFVPLALGLSLGIYYNLKSSKIIKIREDTKKLEDEFASSLFQLGNRLGDGLPAEIAFGKVAAVSRDTVSGEFFETVSDNVSKRGMGLQAAIFDPVKGALVKFPSAIIESTMKVLIESARKGPRIASQALINVSEYIKEIHRVNERLKDLMADIISDMKQQTHILTPAIAGIVVGITSMIVTILGNLGENLQEITAGAGSAGATPYQGLVTLFGEGIPTYYFQIIVGLYVVQIVYILTILTNGIENGADKLGEQFNLGKNLIGSTVIYCSISLIMIFILNFIALMIMSGLG